MRLLFDHDRARYQQRGVAVLLDAGRVLVSRDVAEPFWLLPGGRVEFFETAADCARRELMEEVGARARVGRLLWTAETFFQLGGRRYHELGLYFLAELEPGQPLAGREGDIPGVDHEAELVFRWVPLEALADFPLYPEGLRRDLVRLPEAAEHRIYHDGRGDLT